VFRPARDATAMPTLTAGVRPSEQELAQLELALPVQPLQLGVALCGERECGGWWGNGRGASWADAIEAARTAARAVGVDIEVRAADVAPWHPGRCAELSVGDRVIGHAGELHPRVCAAYGLPARSAVAEIDASALIAAARVVAPAPEFSSFPVAKEDVALIVADEVPAAALAASLREGAGKLCESVRLFDVYTGPQVGEGHKSLAFSLRFRAPDRTLTEAETAGARDAAVNLVAQRYGATQRA